MHRLFIFTLSLVSSGIFLFGCCQVSRPAYVTMRIPVSLTCFPSNTPRIGAIPITIEVTNVNASALNGGGFGFQVQDFMIALYHNGMPVVLTPLGIEKQRYASDLNNDDSAWDGPLEVDHTVSIRPLNSVKVVVDIGPMFEIKQPGEYLVVVKRRFWCPDPILLGATTKLLIAD